MNQKEQPKTRPIPTRFRDAEIARISRAAVAMGIHNRSAVIKLCVHVVLPQIESGNIKIPQNFQEA
jgi:hypothetical protein